MKIVNTNSAPRKENSNGIDARVMYNAENAQAMMITLEPGKSLIPHTTPVNVFFLCTRR